MEKNLKIKSFAGTSKNTAMTQIWIMMYVYVLIAFLKFQSGLTKTMRQLLCLLQFNWLDKRDLTRLLRGDSPNDRLTDVNQIILI